MARLSHEPYHVHTINIYSLSDNVSYLVYVFQSGLNPMSSHTAVILVYSFITLNLTNKKKIVPLSLFEISCLYLTP